MTAIAPVCKLGHIGLRTPDLEASLHFFRDLVGLDVVGEDDGAAYLRAWGENDHHSLVLLEGPAGLDHIALRASSPQDLEALTTALSEHVDLTVVAAGSELGQGDAIRFRSPQGHLFEVYWEMARGRQDSHLINQAGKAYLRGSSPMKLGHIELACADVEAEEAFLAARLGFQRREYLHPPTGPVVASLVSVTSQVCDIALSTGTEQVAYLHNDRSDVLRAAQIMAEAGVALVSGPGRRSMGQTFSCTVRDPGSGYRVELSAGGYYIFEADWEPVRWVSTTPSSAEVVA